MTKLSRFILCGIVSASLLATAKAQVITPYQLRGGLPHVFEKLKQHRPLIIAYLGGSITEMAGYRIQTENYFKTTYPSSKIATINAGVGGTGSYLAAFRLKQDVLRYQPDLVFIEFAVNDDQEDAQKSKEAIEGIIRQIKRANPETDICFLYTIYEPMLGLYRQGKLPSSVTNTEAIAAHYNLPSINLAPQVLERLKQGSLVFKADKNIPSKANQLVFTNDGTHPTQEGHKIYTAEIISAWKSLQNVKAVKMGSPSLMYPHALQYASIQQLKQEWLSGNWQSAKKLPELTPFLKNLPGLVYTDDPNSSITIKFKGREIGFEDIIGPSSNSASITIDGITVKRYRFDPYAFYYHRSYFFVDGLKDGPHTVVIRLDTTLIDKLKMLTPGHKDNLPSYRRKELYIGDVLLNEQP